MDKRFGKKFKLCNEKQIELVFAAKNSIKSYPFVVHFADLQTQTDVPFQITISAPKRNFKKAHERNRIKRILREAIRENKLILETFLIENERKLAVFLIYTAKEELSFDVLQKKMRNLLNQLIIEISNDKK